LTLDDAFFGMAYAQDVLGGAQGKSEVEIVMRVVVHESRDVE